MMNSIQIKHKISKNILFEHNCENNSIKITLECAVKSAADLEGANLKAANLVSADLEGAYLRSANLKAANLVSAYFVSANLEGADLRGAILRAADLRGAYLRGADLEGADLEGADLEAANLKAANLVSAYFVSANLEGANLEGADLRGAIFRGAYLVGADLEKIKTMSLNDYCLISELLWRSSETENQKNFASRIRMESNECWKYFIELAKTMEISEWAYNILSKWPEMKKKMDYEIKNVDEYQANS